MVKIERAIALSFLLLFLLAGLWGQTTLRLQPNQAFVCAPNATMKVCAGPNVTFPGGLPSDCTGTVHISIFTASGKAYEVTGQIDTDTRDTTGPQWSPAP